jgi:hypothetical protein
MWKLVDYRKALKIRAMPVAQMYLTAMLLRNAYVCMNGCQTAMYFKCKAPSFADWVSQDPRNVAH